MNCSEARVLVHPYVDGELDLSASLDLEHHLQECAGCVRELAAVEALHTALETGLTAYRAPAELRRNVGSALRSAERAEGQGRGARSAWLWPAVTAAVAAAALLLLIAWRFAPAAPGLLPAFAAIQPDGTAQAIAAEVVAGHARSLMASHLTDVRSTDQHTVKPWFAGKLDFAPTVQDWASQGFALVGGRLDYLAGRPVAALVYSHPPHTINLFTWPAPGQPDTPVQSLTQQGYHLSHWVQGGMNYWVVSDLNADELQHFVGLLRGAGSSTP